MMTWQVARRRQAVMLRGGAAMRRRTRGPVPLLGSREVSGGTVAEASMLEWLGLWPVTACYACHLVCVLCARPHARHAQF